MIEIQLKRAQLLIEQNRFDEAEKELRQSLASQPDNAEVLALLTICLAEKKNYREANELIQKAISLNPTEPQFLYIYARILIDQNNLTEAQKYINNAITFNPYNAGYFGTLASIHLQRKDWQMALDAANKGLSIDPDNLSCLNIRSASLIKLDKKSEAFDTINEALYQDPDNDATHANYGWGLLEKGEHNKALDHFREALKLNPESAYAKAGLIEALKARYFFYRLFLRYAFWISNFKGKTQWLIILGLYFLVRVLDQIAISMPSVGIFIQPIIIAYATFAISTWIIVPISNLFLRLNIYGKYALSENEKKTSNFVAIMLGIGLIGLIGYLITGNKAFFYTLIFGISMMIPMSGMLLPDKKSSRAKLIIYTSILGCTGLIIITLAFLKVNAGILPVMYIFGIIAYQFIANALIIEKTR